MNIGIDARLIQETGVGRYIRNLVAELRHKDDHNSYVIFLPKKAYDSFLLPNSRWKKVCADVHWHTLAEQFVMPRLFRAEKLDLVHIPYHNPPIGYNGAMILTIHDLTILHFSTGKATTLPLPLYALKRLGYWLELWIGLRKAAKIIAVSETTKREIMDHFHIPERRIAVTYEGVDEHLKPVSQNEKPLISKPYALYVGNAYPHKNTETLIHAFSRMRSSSDAGRAMLVLVGGDDYFYRRLKTQAHDMKLDDSIMFFGSADDRQLANLYTYAGVFVFPSRMEGFGLPALEALSFGCPVIASDIPIFHEILGEHATYTDSNDPEKLCAAIRPFLKKMITEPRKSISVSGRFSWDTMAKETLSLYENSIRL